MTVTTLRNHQRIKQLLKTSQENGWKIEDLHHDWEADNVIGVYLFDLATGFLLATPLDSRTFKGLADGHASGFPATPEEIRNILGSILADLAEDQISTQEISHAKEIALQLAAQYAGQTKTYRNIDERQGYNFCVLLYRHAPEHILRPFAFRLDGNLGLVPPGTLYEYLKHVVSTDVQRHPEWLLPSADIIPFPTHSR